MTDEFDEEEIKRVEQFIELMIELGALEIAGYDKDSDSFTYTITPKMKELIPEFFEEHMKFVNELAFELWQKGYVEIYFDENGPLVTLKEDIDYINIMKDLNEDEKIFIENMMRHYKGGII